MNVFLSKTIDNSTLEDLVESVVLTDATIAAYITSLSSTAAVIDGTAAAPGIPTSTDATSGLYNEGGDVGISQGGVKRVHVDANETVMTKRLKVDGAGAYIEAPAGTAAAPTYTFTGDTDTGPYLSGANSYSVATNGVLRTTVDTAAVTSTLPWLGPNGTAAAPSLSFSGTPDLGVYRASATGLGISTSGVNRVTVDDTTGVVSTLVFAAPVGTALLPSYTFASDSNSGFYSITNNSIGTSTNGALRMTVDTAAVTSTLPWLGPAGTVGAPAISFSGDPDTGLYNTANTVLVACGGLRKAQIGSNGLQIPANSSVSAPGLSFLTDTNSGINVPSASTLGITVASTQISTYATTGVTNTVPLLESAGSAAAPSTSFSGDPDTGLYSKAANDLGISTAGTLRMNIDTAAVTSTLPFVAPVGSAAAPSITFAGDLDSGIFHEAANTIVIATAGVDNTVFGENINVTSLPFWFATGSASNPSVSFNGDSNTGLYNPVGNTIGAACNGSLKFSIGESVVSANVPVQIAAVASSGVASPATGMLIMDTDTASVLRVYQGGGWKTVTAI